MIDAPSRLVCHASLPHEFHGRNPVAAGSNQEHGVEPCFEGCGGFVEYCASSGGHLKTTPRAGVAFTVCDRMKTVGFGAFVALSAVRKALIEKVLQAISIRLELLIEVFNRIFHVPKITYHYLLSRDNSEEFFIATKRTVFL